MAELNIKMFGTPQISVDGRPAAFPYRKVDALLYYMVIQKRETRSELAGLLWDEADQATALKNLRHAVYYIRKELKLDIFTTGHSAILELNPALKLHCDVLEFLERGDLSVCQGEFLEGFEVSSSQFEDWMTEERNILNFRYLKELLAETRAAFQRGDYPRAEQLGVRYLQRDPLEESVVVILIEVYSAQKKFRKAAEVYQELCRNLTREMGISPLKETSARYYQAVRAWNASADPKPYLLLGGKDAALRSLLFLCNTSAGGGRAPCVLVQGEAGVGKTYLVDHLLDHYDFSDWIVCRGNCYQSESAVSLSPWHTIMMSLAAETENRGIALPERYQRVASGLFPCLSAGEEKREYAAELDPPMHQNYAVAEESAMLLLMSVAKRYPVLLIFEDIHWMDQHSAAMLGAFLRRIRGTDMTVICTARDRVPEHMRDLIDSARRDGVMECCSLHCFSREETEQFVRESASQNYGGRDMEQIYQSTGGNALLLVQLMNFLQENPDPSVIPSGLESILMDRLSRLTPEERQVLDLISVFTDCAPLDALSSILTMDAVALISICSQLKMRMLITEEERDGEICYALEHRQIQSVLMKLQPSSVRRALNLRVARYLEENPENRRQHCDRLIHYFERGGDRLKEFQYRVLSIHQYAEKNYAVFPILPEDSGEEEVQNVPDYFRRMEQTLTSLREAGTDSGKLDPLECILLHAKSCYDIYEGLYPDGLNALDRLVRLCGKTGNQKLLVRAHLQYIFYGVQIWDPRVMELHLKAGMKLLSGREMTEDYAIYLRMQGLLFTMQGLYEDAMSALEHSLRIFCAISSENGDRYAINVAGTWNYIAEVHRLNGRFEEAFRAYDQAILYSRSRGYYSGIAVFYTNYGAAACEKGEQERAWNLFHQALSAYRTDHLYSQRPIALSYLAYEAAEKGDYAGAADYLREAFQVSRQIGSPWWHGITLYQCWKIRELLDQRGDAAEKLRTFWPADPIEHLRRCLHDLHRLQPRKETAEMEEALRKLTGVC